MDDVKHIVEKRMEELNIHPSRRLGQNFLISQHVVDRVIQATKALKPSQLVEVGPGLGSLTEFLHHFKVPLQLIELDKKLAEYWQKMGYICVQGDALQFDWRELELTQGSVLVSNLPYQISSSLLIERSVRPRGVHSMVLMFQKEVAQRIVAEEGTKDYSLLSVMAQTFWNVTKVMDVGARAFIPPPKVLSRVLQFTPKETQVHDRMEFLSFLKHAFLYRRKFVIKSLMPFFGKKQIQQDQVLEKMSEIGLTEKSRAQEISLEQYIELYFFYRNWFVELEDDDGDLPNF